MQRMHAPQAVQLGNLSGLGALGTDWGAIVTGAVAVVKVGIETGLAIDAASKSDAARKEQQRIDAERTQAQIDSERDIKLQQIALQQQAAAALAAQNGTAVSTFLGLPTKTVVIGGVALVALGVGAFFLLK